MKKKLVVLLGISLVVAMQGLGAAQSPNEQLMAAGTVEQARAAIDAGADINYHDECNCTILDHYIMSQKSYEDDFLDFILARNFNLNGGGYLLWAAELNLKDIIIKFLEFGADPYCKNAEGLSIIDSLNKQNMNEIADFIGHHLKRIKGSLRQHSVNVDLYHVILKPLHQAAQDGDLSKVNELIAQGYDVNERDVLGFTPLHCAARKGRLAVVQALIIAKADARITDDLGKTAVSYAFINKRFSVVAALKESGTR